MSTFAWHFLALIFLQINLYHLRHQLVQLIRRTAARKTQTTMPPWSQLPTCGGGFHIHLLISHMVYIKTKILRIGEAVRAPLRRIEYSTDGIRQPALQQRVLLTVDTAHNPQLTHIRRQLDIRMSHKHIKLPKVDALQLFGRRCNNCLDEGRPHKGRFLSLSILLQSVHKECHSHNSAKR